MAAGKDIPVTDTTLPGPARKAAPTATLAAARRIGLAALGLALFLALWEALPPLGLVNPMLPPVPSVIPAASRAAASPSPRPQPIPRPRPWT